MTALTRLGLMHGSGALPWISSPALEFDRGELAELVIGTDVDIVTITDRLPRRRYGVRFDSGAQLTVQAHHLAKVAP